MTTREKVILSLTAIAALGAGVYYTATLSASPSSRLAAAPTDYTALMAQVQVSLKQGELTDREERVLTAATTQWLRDPLRPRPLSNLDDGSNPSAPLPKYMGFINTGPQPIAIIDGQDYRPGEAVKGGEFHLAQIFPNHIELLRRGATDPVDVPLEKPQAPARSR